MTCAYHYIGSVMASMIVQMAWMKSTAPHRKVWIVKTGEVAFVKNLVPHLEHISKHVSNLD